MRQQGIGILLSLLLALAACSAPQRADDTLGVLGGAHFASSTLTRGSLIASFTVQGVGNPDQSGYLIGLVVSSSSKAPSDFAP